jgi:hypothetical protein
MTTELNADFVRNVKSPEPIQLDTKGEIQKNWAQTSQIQSETSLTPFKAAEMRARTQGADLDNQVKQLNLNNIKAGMSAYQAIAGAAGQYRQGDSNDGATPVLPPGVKPHWKEDPNTGWYVEDDGKGNTVPVSRVNGPKYDAKGRPNFFNNDMINTYYEALLKSGATPQFAMDTRNSMIEKGLTIDKDTAANHAAMQGITKANQEIEAKKMELQSSMNAQFADAAYKIVNSQNPVATTQSAYTQMPEMFNHMVGPIDFEKGLTPEQSERLHKFAASSGLNEKALDAAGKVQQQEFKPKEFDQTQSTILDKVKTATTPAQAVYRQADLTEGLVDLVDYLKDKGGNTPVSALMKEKWIPNSVKNLVSGTARDGTIDYQSVVAILNDNLLNLDAGIQNTEGVRGGMGSDIRAEGTKTAAGGIPTDINDKTTEMHLNISRQYIKAARHSSENIVKNNNKTLELAGIPEKYHFKLEKNERVDLRKSESKSEAKTEAKTEAKSGYKIGDTVTEKSTGDKYSFKGGDHKDKKNWIRVK